MYYVEAIWLSVFYVLMLVAELSFPAVAQFDRSFNLSIKIGMKKGFADFLCCCASTYWL